MSDKFSAAVTIQCTPALLWKALTNPPLMKQWMGDADMDLRIETSWQPGTPIFIRGFHHGIFENKGTIIQYEKERALSYSHLSSVSRLPDVAGNYAVLEFIITPFEGCTELALYISNFPTDVIRKHLEFYWGGTIVKIRQLLENR